MATKFVAKPVHEHKLVKFFTWEIENFRWGNLRLDERVLSPPFVAGSNATGNLKWSLFLIALGEAEEFRHLSVYLRLNTAKNARVRATCIFSILNSKGDKAYTKDTDHVFTQAEEDWGFECFITRNTLYKKNLLPRGSLTIFCELHIFEEKSIANHALVQLKTESSLSDDFEKLLFNEKYSDVTFQVEGLEFPAHKIILAMRSDVLAAMFDHDLEERRQNRVVITDIEARVFQEVLRYIYTDKLPNLDNMAHDIFVAADKYNIKRLKEICECKMYEKLTIISAAETLVLADLHSADILKKLTIEYICAQSVVVFKTFGWQKMIAYPHLLNEVLRSYVTYTNSSKYITKL